MSKFIFSIGFALEVISDSKILTCTCSHSFEIKLSMFGETETLLRCPKCNELWHLEESYKDKTIFLLNPRANVAIAIRNVGGEWVKDSTIKSKC